MANYSRRASSLKAQLIALVLALGVPLLFLQGWWSMRDFRSARGDAEANALAVADAIALGVLQFFGQAEELMMATADEFGNGWLVPDACPQHMETVTTLFPFLTNALAVGPSGEVICSALPGRSGLDASSWPWFEQVTRNPVFTLGGPVATSTDSTWVLPMVAPVVDPDGSFAGAIVGTVALVQLSRLFGGVAIPEDHLVTVATSDRIIISRSVDPANRVGQPLPPMTGSDREVAPGRWVATGPDLLGVPRTWGQVEIDPGWIVYVGVPDDLVFGPARRESLAHVGLTLLVVLLGIFVASLSYRRIAAALRELATRTRATTSGHAVDLPPDLPREVSEVVEQFNHTLAARDRAEAAERSARKRFEALFENAVVGLYVSTVDGRFLQVNQHLVQMLGYPTADALMEVGPVALYSDPTQRRRLVQDSIQQKRVHTAELDWLRADGVPITVRVGGKIIPGPGGEQVFEMIVQDVTDEKRTEDELRQTQKMEAIGQLAGGVAHDFNNLLTVIGGNVELLEDELTPADPLREDLAQISKATKRAATLTRRLLAFSRKQRRGEHLIDVNEIVPDVTRMLVPLIGETVALEVDLGAGPYPVDMDGGEFEQILLNLVLNARDAMPRGGRVRITTRPESRCPDGDGNRSESAEGVLLAVIDTGRGMDEATTGRIFEPFYTTKPMGEGTGLGLSTVYGIVRRSGGFVGVESEPGGGTTMTVWLPLTAATRVVESEPAAPLSVTGTETILVVEDDTMVRRFVDRALSDAGYRVVTAESGDAAMDLLRVGDTSVDLVLTDVVMPGVSGPELAERLALYAPETPLLFMSGYVDNPFLSEQFDRLPDSMLRKPFSASEVRTRVRMALDRRSSEVGETEHPA